MCNVCAHRYAVLPCIWSACVHRLVHLLCGLLSQLSVPEPLGMGTFSFPISSPIQPHPSLGTRTSLILETGSCQSIHLSGLAAAATLSPLPFLPQESAWFP